MDGKVNACLAMCHRLSGIPTYGLSGLEKGDEHHAYVLHSSGAQQFSFTITNTASF